MVQHDKLQQTLMHLFTCLVVLCCVLPYLLMLIESGDLSLYYQECGHNF